MPLVQGRKRRAPAEERDASPSASASASEGERGTGTQQAATQRRRISPSASPIDGRAHPDSSLDQLAKKLVRLALACEYQRKPIRRADVSEKVLGAAGARLFKPVFQEAQLQLMDVFGMQMVELPARERVTLAQRRAAAQKGADKQNKTVTQWILTSALPSKFRDPAILPPPAVPTAREEGTYIALYTLIVSLILLSGGTLPDSKLERYLTRLNMQDNSPLEGYEKTEKLLKRMERDGYVVKVRESTGGDEQVDWTVGPRGRVEVGEDGVAGLTKAVYGDLDEEAEVELDRRLARSLGIGEGKFERKSGQQNKQKEKQGGRKRGREAEGVQEEEEEEDGSDDDEE